MTLTVREMTAAGTDVVVDYFLGSTPEHLDMLGVDPTGFRPRHSGASAFDVNSHCQPSSAAWCWLSNDQPIGFSTADKIRFGEQANMHLHVMTPNAGIVPIKAGASSQPRLALS